MSEIVKKYSLDKEKAKQDLIDHYKSIDRYKEWDFEQEGSGLNLLADMLAYNTSQNAFINNRLISEFFLESTQKRPMAVASANTLGGYLPRSAKCSRTRVKLTINFQKGAPVPEYIVVPKGQRFLADGGFRFYIKESHVLYPSSAGFASSSFLDIYEGKRVSYQVPGSQNGTVLSAINSDLSTLNIFINGLKARAVGIDIDISEVKSDTLCYYIKENFEGRYEITFGDGFMGYQTTDSDQVYVDYIVSENLDLANGLNVFTTDPIGGFSDITIEVEERTHSGSSRESLQSIKRRAPMHFSAANRGVNKNDYKYLIETNFPYVRSVSVWGGEEAEEKNYGAVYFSAINQNGDGINTSQKSSIKEFLNKFNVGSITPIAIDPIVSTIYPIITIVLDPNKVDYSVNNAKKIVTNSIKEYSDEITGFSTEYSSTTLSNYIGKNLMGIKYIKVENGINKVIPAGYSSETEINFETALYHPFDGYNKESNGIINSTEIKDEKTGISYFLNDDGYGNVRRYYNDTNGKKVYVNDKQGTVNYSNGKIKIFPFNGLGQNQYTIVGIPSKNIIKATGNTILKLTSENAVVVIETNV